MAVYFHTDHQRENIEELINLGQSYLEEGDYEQAVATLNFVLYVDPKELSLEEEQFISENKDVIVGQLVDAYIAWSNEEIERGNYERANRILKRGKKDVGTEKKRFNKQLDKVFVKQYVKDDSDVDEMIPFFTPVIYHCIEEDLSKWTPNSKDHEAFWRILAGYAQDALYDSNTPTVRYGSYMLIDEDELNNAAYALFSDYDGVIPPVDDINSVYDEKSGKYGLILGDYGEIYFKEEIADRNENEYGSVEINYIVGEWMNGEEISEPHEEYRIHLVLNRKHYESHDTKYLFCVNSVKLIGDSLQLENSTDESSKAQKDLLLQENIVPNEVFASLPDSFWFSSGVGAWGTDLHIDERGFFHGEYHDSNMDEVYICNFSGRFSEPKPVTPYIYSMRMEELEWEGNIGDIYYEDGIKYIRAEPYGLDDADEFLIYMPGTPISEIADGFMSWSDVDGNIRSTLPKGYYGLYNIGGEEGFSGEDDGMVWGITYKYVFEECESSLIPSYFGNSNLWFKLEEGQMAINLIFEWREDDQTKFKAHDTDSGDEYDIEIHFNEDKSQAKVYVERLDKEPTFAPWGWGSYTFEGTYIKEEQ